MPATSEQPRAARIGQKHVERESFMHALAAATVHVKVHSVVTAGCWAFGGWVCQQPITTRPYCPSLGPPFEPDQKYLLAATSSH
ncbi:hypothetical protein HaLaN_17797 [Haematococcus lacustris]|uniref:Uncharacterized protein n=1 Tax=Haematococcus lacustris TaxID=44745 RepID=A0A699ZPJ4_HAELA|nr:hypothetical protein HaLaN_17797 [Haematococcus lacustris]